MRLLTWLVALGAVGSVAAQNRTLPAVRAKAPPTIDGSISAEEWAAAPVAEGFVNPATGKPAPYETRAYILYDEVNVYVGFVCRDPDPKALRATEYRRGVNLDGNDRVVFLLNPFSNHREEDFNVFEVGAGGGMEAEFGGGRALKREWQGEWDAKARITEEGFEVEVVIPWTILRLPSPGLRDLEINFGRQDVRNNARYVWSDIGPDERWERNGIWTGVRVPKVAAANLVQLLPYQIIGFHETHGLEFNTGIDARYQPSSNMTALGSVNPDFKNIENAVLSLEFSRFERLARETRPFFVEGGDFFRFGGMSAQMFAPQRIGQFDAGMKLFGKLSDDESFGTVGVAEFGGFMAGVVRYRKTWSERTSATAGYALYTDDDTSVTNHAAGLDVTLQGERWGIGTNLGLTKDSVLGSGLRTDVDILYRDNYIRGSVGYQRITSDFFPRLGFAPRRGFRGWHGFVQYERQYPAGIIHAIEVDVSARDTWNDDDSGVYLRDYNVNADVSFQSGLKIEAGVKKSNFQGLKDTIYAVGASYPVTDAYRNVSLQLMWGEVDADNYKLASIGGNYRFPFRLSVGAEFQFETIGASTESQHVIGLNYELSEFRAISGRAVVRNGKTNWYLAFRQSGNLGAEYYLIIGDPNSDDFQKRLILKAVIPVDIKLR